MIEERTISIVSHGRYLVCVPASAASNRAPHPAPGAPVLVGFHGYAESAEVQLARLRDIPGADRWLLVSIQGPHRGGHEWGPEFSRAGPECLARFA